MEGRADQATKVKGMFVRPEQVVALLERHPEVHKARVEVNHDGKNDTLLVRLETEGTETAGDESSIRELLKLRADVVLCRKSDLPCDGLENEFNAAGNAVVGCGFITWSLANQPELLIQVLD